MPSSRAIARGGAPAPKCNVISLLYPPHGQPLGRHPSLDRLRWSTGRQLYADLRNATLLPVAPNRQELTPGGPYMANTLQGEFPNQNLGLDGYVGTSPVGAFPANGYGLHDMIGAPSRSTPRPAIWDSAASSAPLLELTHPGGRRRCDARPSRRTARGRGGWWSCRTVAVVCGCGGAGFSGWRGGRGGCGRAGRGQCLDGEVGDHDGDDDERGGGESGF